MNINSAGENPPRALITRKLLHMLPAIFIIIIHSVMLTYRRRKKCSYSCWQ